jgi:hypothetical protein
MEKAKFVRTAEYAVIALMTGGIFVFFGFFYNHHLHFAEQFQLFLFSFNYLIEKLILPGGIAGYLGEFLTQFYFISLAGPLVIASLFLALGGVIRKILLSSGCDRSLAPLGYIPSLFAVMLTCNEFYPLSVVTGFLLAMIAGMLYTSIRKKLTRFIAGLIIIPLVYWLAGGSYLSMILMMIVFEIGQRRKAAGTNTAIVRPGFINGWLLIIYCIVAAVLPLMTRLYIVSEPVMSVIFGRFYYNIPGHIPPAVMILFLIPPVLMIIVSRITIKERFAFRAIIAVIVLITGFCLYGFRSFSNFEAEETMKYDYLVREGRWEDVLKYASKHPPNNYLSLSMLNLSLSRTGKMGNDMFTYDQHGINGLFLAFNKEYVAPLMGNEILYHIGLINASQQYAFESMETIPSMGKSGRIIKRLAETNLINGQYKTSEKYLFILEKTLFYRRWAKKTREYLYNEEKINEDPVWGEKRRFLVVDDYFFHIQDIETVLRMMVREHPDNIAAFEYLMAFYLMTKDLGRFSEFIPVMEKMQYNQVPSLYQEAITFILASGNVDPFTASPPYITRDVKNRLKAYADIYNTYQDSEERLRSKYSGTYWYYLHFNDYQYNPEEVIQKNLY